MTEDNQQNSQNGSSNASKRLARLVAVQSLYQASFDEEKLSDIIQRGLDEADSILNGEEDSAELIKERPDPELYADIVRGVREYQCSLEDLISGALSSDFSSPRMERLLRAVLLAGAYELHHHASVSHKIIISDYVDVTRAFFGSKEPGLVNAVLDKVAQKIRSL